ncbi:MAG: sulfotransferase family protein [Caulobacteraceae bacterium]
MAHELAAPARDEERAASPSERRCILVVGMHRSGTSAVTATLHAMGAAVSGDLIGGGADNPDGFWESAAVVRIHERFLAAIGSTWDEPRPVPPSAYAGEAARVCQAELAAVVARDFAAAPLFAMKDPRICKLLPIWKAALAELGVRPLAVMPVRNPLEVALSLQRRNGVTREHALALWLVHALAAERETRGLTRAFTGFDTFVNTPEAAARALCGRLDCFSPGQVESGLARTQTQWSAGRRHHVVSDAALGEDPAIPVWIGETWRWLAAAAEGAEPPAARLDAIAEALTRTLEIYSPFFSYAIAHVPRAGFLERLARRLKR